MSRPTEKRRLLTERVLDDDIVFDILTRLPVKSLIRFRCVSKSWYSTITNPIFIATHFKLNEAKSLSNKNSHNGYLLYTSETEDYSFHAELRTLVYNRDRTVTEISRCNENNGDHIIYLWNPSIRKFKMLAPALMTDPCDSATLGLAYHSQKNDFKILRLVSFLGSLGEPDPLTEAEVYTLSTDSWRKVVSAELSDPNAGLLSHRSPYIFFNGALHCIAAHKHCSFILSFDINDERFHKIMLPLDFLDVYQSYLTVFKGSLAYIIISDYLATGGIMCHLWVMKEYGVAETWTRKCVPIDWFHHFHGCTDNGELLIENAMGLISIDPENLFQNSLIMESNIRWAGYAANSIESLVLLDGVNVSSEYED
ncbi:hypothetical protein RGQ29_024569 [Quercus rubra]|uniref:F-box domain-containing protein n=1 Tax=Quercus rubra TaxID=3512 RepID=A0AAN7EWG6_QUERU|nr:hypothetical protein RGQ29_024569 [Quercus rubra]